MQPHIPSARPVLASWRRQLEDFNGDVTAIESRVENIVLQKEKQLQKPILADYPSLSMFYDVIVALRTKIAQGTTITADNVRTIPAVQAAIKTLLKNAERERANFEAAVRINAQIEQERLSQELLQQSQEQADAILSLQEQWKEATLKYVADGSLQTKLMVKQGDMMVNALQDLADASGSREKTVNRVQNEYILLGRPRPVGDETIVVVQPGSSRGTQTIEENGALGSMPRSEDLGVKRLNVDGHSAPRMYQSPSMEPTDEAESSTRATPEASRKGQTASPSDAKPTADSTIKIENAANVSPAIVREPTLLDNMSSISRKFISALQMQAKETASEASNKTIMLTEEQIVVASVVGAIASVAGVTNAVNSGFSTFLWGRRSANASRSSAKTAKKRFAWDKKQAAAKRKATGHQAVDSASSAELKGSDSSSAAASRQHQIPNPLALDQLPEISSRQLLAVGEKLDILQPKIKPKMDSPPHIEMVQIFPIPEKAIAASEQRILRLKPAQICHRKKLGANLTFPAAPSHEPNTTRFRLQFPEQQGEILESSLIPAVRDGNDAHQTSGPSAAEKGKAVDRSPALDPLELVGMFVSSHRNLAGGPSIKLDLQKNRIDPERPAEASAALNEESQGAENYSAKHPSTDVMSEMPCSNTEEPFQANFSAFGVAKSYPSDVASAREDAEFTDAAPHSNRPVRPDKTREHNDTLDDHTQAQVGESTNNDNGSSDNLDNLIVVSPDYTYNLQSQPTLQGMELSAVPDINEETDDPTATASGPSPVTNLNKSTSSLPLIVNPDTNLNKSTSSLP
ncbi:hypothetical protein V500_05819 [Pseudogymnoascus sp. VKM F-4518 (FW-2643)]|nr:hypothetical protein V500_05819 [Pseudogymnoascus sp. VKM F-4518 (FW-2643)]